MFDVLQLHLENHFKVTTSANKLAWLQCEFFLDWMIYLIFFIAKWKMKILKIREVETFEFKTKIKSAESVWEMALQGQSRGIIFGLLSSIDLSSIIFPHKLLISLLKNLFQFA